MAPKAGTSPSTAAAKVAHLMFHPDEERESEARLAELGGVDMQSAHKAREEGHASQNADHITAAFGTLNSI